MKIDLYISQLLYRYQCVTVPGFGAFLTTFYSAEVNEFTNTFSAPRKLISFNALLQNNDGILANHIVENQKISYENAILIIENAVTEWQQLLQGQKTISISKIGILSENKNQKIVFEPLPNTNFLMSSFGLNQFISQDIARICKSDVIKDPQTIFEPKLDIIHHSKPNYLKYAASVAIGLGAFGFVGNSFYNQHVAAKNQIVQLEVQKEVQQKIQQATFVIPNPLDYVNANIPESEMVFHIVAGKFRNLKNAKRLTSKLQKLGFKPQVLAKDPDGLSQVIFGSYPTFGTAQLALESIQKNENPDAWILIKKL
ncbi:MAG: hypothetical protein RLZZ312_2013 [Bacteroidota bacterium]|jgi:hypothetical protein